MMCRQGRGMWGRVGLATWAALAFGGMVFGQPAEADGAAPPAATRLAVPDGGTLAAKVRVIDDQAELIPLAVHRSAMIETAEPVRTATVVNPDIAEVTPVSGQIIIIRGKSFGATQVILLAESGRKKAYTVAVGMDATQLEAAIRAAAPQGDVHVEAILDTIVLRGVVPDAEAADQVAQLASIFSPKVQNHLRVAGAQQVLLRCTVAEVSRRAIRQLGFNGFTFGHDFFLANNLNQISPVGIGTAGGLSVEAPQLVPPQRFSFLGPGGPGPQASIYFGLPRAQTEIFVQALNENGLLRVLAEPNLVAISGQTASFLAGGEFPVPVPQGGTTNSITIEWRKFGVQLSFTPAVLPNQRVRLKVAPEVSELDYSNAVQLQGYTVPGLTNRRAETVIEVGNAQTFALAGLLSEQVRGVSRKIPGLGHVPVLGALFSSVEYRKNETELLILVTPELVAPLDPQQVPPVPGQFTTDPNDWQLYGLGLLDGEPAVAVQPGATTRRSGPAGVCGAWGPADYDEKD